MTVKYWTNYTKKKNSTAQPSGILANTLTVNLKEGTSVETPTFLVSGDILECSYVQAFGSKYYFVTDIKSVRKGLTEISCRMDPLATHKTEIGNYTALIERSAAHYDSKYPDPLVSIMNDEVVNDTAASVSFFSKTGCYAVSVLNDSGYGGTGFTTTYIMSTENVVRLSNYINTNWGSAATDVLDWLQATFLRTADSVISCIWIPISYDSISGSEYLVRVGVDNISGCYGKPVSSTNIASSSAESITIPHYYSDFRKFSPYTQCKLFIPMYGCIDINPGDFSDDVIKVGFYLDLTTGDCLAIITDGSDEMVTNVRYNAGVSCPVGRVASDVTGTLGGIFSTASAIGMARAGGQYAAIHGIAAAAAGVNTLATATGVTPAVQGSRGGRAMADLMSLRCITVAKKTQDPATLLTEAGRPCMDRYQISNCSGFVKCVNASISIDGIDSERDEINDFLNNGFYYE